MLLEHRAPAVVARLGALPCVVLALALCDRQTFAQPGAGRDAVDGRSEAGEAGDTPPPEDGPTPGQQSAPAQPEPPELLASSTVLWPRGVPAPPAVSVFLTVNRDGLPEDIEIEGGALPEAGLAAVLAAARELRFSPARSIDGHPISARVRFRFALEATSEPERDTPASGPVATEPPAAATEPPATVSDRNGNGAPPPALALEAPIYGARARVDPPKPGAATQVQLRGEELTVVPGTFGEPLRVVSALPGVARTPWGFGFFAVRGASLQNTGFLVDNFPVPLLYHLGAGPAILSSRLVDGLDFFAGGYPLTYGRYTAGLISLRTAPPQTDGALLELEVDLLKASVLGVLPFDDGRGTVAVALRRSYYDLIVPLVTDDVSISYADYQLRVDYQFSRRAEASLFLFGSRDSFQFSQELGAGQTVGQAASGVSYSFDRLIASLRYRASDEVRLSWAATAGPSGIDFGRESTGDASVGIDTTSLRLGQRVAAIYTPSAYLQTTVGVEQNVWINEFTGASPSFGELPYIPAPGMTLESLEVADRLVELTMAPYVEQVLRPGPFVITGGLRAEYYRYGDVSTWALEPRTVVRFRASNALTLKAAVGLFSQAPLPFQVNRSFGNPKVLPNRALQNSVGVEVELPWEVELESTLFWNQMWQLTRGSGRPSMDAQGNPVLLVFEDDGEGRAYGLELLVRRRIQRGLFGWLSYTLSRSERFIPGGQRLPFFFDQTHVLNLASSYKIGAWRFGGRFMLATGRPAIAFQRAADGHNVVFDADEDDFNSEYGSRRVRLPTFHQFDVRIDYEFTWGPVESSVYLDIINVYAAQNSEGFIYEYDYSERGRLPGLPFLPTIGFRGVLR